MEVLQDYDQQIRQGPEEILNARLEEDTWTQSTLPVAQGGLGIILTSDLALPAFLASSYGATFVGDQLLSSPSRGGGNSVERDNDR